MYFTISPAKLISLKPFIDVLVWKLNFPVTVTKIFSFPTFDFNAVRSLVLIE